jgi:hypothetical protein
MSEKINTSKDVEMKDDTKKEVPTKKEVEPIDPFYGKYLLNSLSKYSILNSVLLRIQKELSIIGEGSKG